MKTMLMAGFAVLASTIAAAAEQPQVPDENSGVDSSAAARPMLLLLAERRSTPDTSMPGSTAPGNPMASRRHSTRMEQYYAAELRRCETLGDTSERLACKDSVRDKYGEM